MYISSAVGGIQEENIYKKKLWKKISEYLMLFL